MLKLKRAKGLSNQDPGEVPGLIIPLLAVSDEELKAIQDDGVFQEAPPSCVEATDQGRGGWQWALVEGAPEKQSISEPSFLGWQWALLEDADRTAPDQNEIVLALVGRETGDALLVQQCPESALTGLRKAALEKLGVPIKWGSWPAEEWRLLSGRYTVCDMEERECCPCCFTPLATGARRLAMVSRQTGDKQFRIDRRICDKTSGLHPAMDDAVAQFRNTNNLYGGGGMIGVMMLSVRAIREICKYRDECTRNCSNCERLPDYRRTRNG